MYETFGFDVLAGPSFWLVLFSSYCTVRCILRRNYWNTNVSIGCFSNGNLTICKEHWLFLTRFLIRKVSLHDWVKPPGRRYAVDWAYILMYYNLVHKTENHLILKNHQKRLNATFLTFKCLTGRNFQNMCYLLSCLILDAAGFEKTDLFHFLEARVVNNVLRLLGWMHLWTTQNDTCSKSR